LRWDSWKDDMARLEDIPEPTRTNISALACASLDARPFVSGPPLSRRRVSILSSAALFSPPALPFTPGSAEYRELPASLPAADIHMSHVSINFDRSGWQRDFNVVYPMDRLRELATAGVIGSVADVHFSVMGSTDPALMEKTADDISVRMKQYGVDAVVLCPV
jgi:D-proline reductase (dithiol) PrdB